MDTQYSSVMGLRCNKMKNVIQHHTFFGNLAKLILLHHDDINTSSFQLSLGMVHIGVGCAKFRDVTPFNNSN